MLDFPLLKPLPALFLMLSCCGVRAAVSGDFTYMADATGVTITDFPPTVAGAVVIPDTIAGKPVLALGANAFADCPLVTDITIPATVTKLGEAAFARCAGLASLELPSGLREIGRHAFRGCSSLTTLDLPPVVDVIGELPFLECQNLAQITTLNGSYYYATDGGVLYSKDMTVMVQCPPGKVGAYVTPVWLNKIPARGFSGCSKLTTATLGGSLTSMGSNAFEDCTSLTSARIPESLQDLPGGCFQGCTSLLYVEMLGGLGVRSIGGGAFADCVSLRGVSTSGALASIAGGAFRNCRSLTGFAIGDSVSSISEGAFVGCSSLKITRRPDPFGGFRVTDGVLYDFYTTRMLWCPPSKTGTFTIPDSVNLVDAYAFDGCVKLTKLIFPGHGNTTVTLRPNALTNCPNLDTVLLATGNAAHYKAALGGYPAPRKLELGAGPDPVMAVGALKEIPGLVQVKLGYGMAEVPANAFLNCPDLEAVVFLQGTTGIGAGAFAGCPKLRSVTIPATVTSIGAGAFANSGLERLAFLGNAPAIEEGAFDTLPAGFRSYYFSRFTGFTAPLWKGRESVDMGTDSGDKVWRVGHRLAYDLPLTHEPRGGGITLLVGYALGLDPNEQMGPQLPAPSAADGKLSITALRSAQGVTYVFETSTDLQDWTTSGVTLTSGSPTQASVPLTDGPRFLRVRVTK